MPFIKIGEAEILKVLPEDESRKDEEARKAMDKASEEIKKNSKEK